jgi:secondary thiamine-phosphate synthase enzyme
MQTIKVQTKSPRDIVDITDMVDGVLLSEVSSGEVCHLFVMHTTAALTTVYIDPENELDLIGMMETMVPHPHHLHVGSAEDAHTHLKTSLPPDVLASFLGASLTIPVKGGKLLLGTFQRIILVDFKGPGTREVIVVS